LGIFSVALLLRDFIRLRLFERLIPFAEPEPEPEPELIF
jgi:hypothetical protein